MRGISHITFIVRDLERMAALLCQGLGAREVYDSGGRQHSLSPEKFFLLGGTWIAAMQGDPPATRSYQHVAFSVEESELPDYMEKLSALGVEISNRAVVSKARVARCISTTSTIICSSCIPARWNSAWPRTALRIRMTCTPS